MGKLIFMRRFWEYGKRMKIRKLFEDNSRYGTDSHYLMQSGRKTQKQQQRKRINYLEKQSVITIIKKISTHFLQEFLQEQDIWWNQIKNMEKAEVMWLFMTL